MKVGIIGTGVMGRNHVRVYNDLRGVEEIFVFDADLSISKQVAHQYNIQNVDNLDDLLRKVDAVSICAPTSKHYEIVQKVLEKGVSCLIEKPIASSLEEARKIAELADKSKVIVGVGHIERFNPVIKEIKKIGENPVYIEIERHNPHIGRITDTDVTADLLIHDIDLVWNYFLQGRKYKILGVGGVKKNLFELVAILVDFEGCIVKISGSRISAKKNRQLLMECVDKTLIANFIAQELYVHKKTSNFNVEHTKYSQESIVDKVLVNKVEPLREELKTFLNCIKDGKPFPISVADGTKALEISTEIRTKL